MIVKMKKYSFLLHHASYEQFLQEMRALGVLHIEEKGDITPEELATLQQLLSDKSRMEKTARHMQNRIAPKTEAAPAADQVDAAALLEEYENLNESKNHIQQQQTALQKEIDRMQPWGDFSYETLNQLEKAGYQLSFYTINERLFNPLWEEQSEIITIGKEGSSLLFVAVHPVGENPELENAEPVKLAEHSLQELYQELAAAKATEKKTDETIERFAVEHLNSLHKAIRQQKARYEYQRVLTHTNHEAEESIRVLEGWVPVTRLEAVDQYLEKEGICYLVADPEATEKVPILLKNNAFSRLFEAIGSLYDLPNYHELDLTPFFAPFFVMFFGLCLGDAGYGLLLTIGALIAKNKVKPALKPFMGLAFWLGIGTVVFGTISGTLFGINLLEVNWSWVKNLKAFMMNSDQLFTFALIVGAVQILFGMILKAVVATRRFGFLNALPHWSWLLLILGCGTTYGLQYKEIITPEIAKISYIAVAGVAALGIFLLNNLHRNPLINIGAGMWESYNMATGLLGDLLSYIRLFALGISGAVMGLVFNDIAMNVSASLPIIVSQIVMIAILLFGHSLNIFMSGLGAFVHPMRLTFVEFYKNAGFEGGGKKYQPFQEEKEEVV